MKQAYWVMYDFTSRESATLIDDTTCKITDLANGYWDQVIDFQINDTSLNGIKTIWEPFFKVALAQLTFDRIAVEHSLPKLWLLYLNRVSLASRKPERSKKEMTNLWSRLTEPCVISLPLHLPLSLMTLPARLLDLVNGYWDQVIGFQMNGTNLKRVKTIWAFCELAFAQLIFDHIARTFSTKTETMVCKPSQPQPHFFSGRVFKLRWLRTSQLINIQWTIYIVHKKSRLTSVTTPNRIKSTLKMPSR